MMKLNFSKLFKPMLIVCAALAFVGILFLILFGGRTFATYTMQNLRPSLFVKALVAAVLVLVLTLIYFLIRYKKNGLFLALFSALSAFISAVVAFSLCVICRAHLGGITFALMLFAVALSYVTSVTFANNFVLKKVTRKNTAEPAQDNYSNAANQTWKSVLYIVAVICIVIVAAFVASLVFAVKVVPQYALPAILVTVISVIQTIAVGCKLYASKV